MLAGRPPFVADDPRVLMLMQVSAYPDPLRSIRPDLPAGLCGLVDALLMKDRAARPPDAARVRRDLAAIYARVDSGEALREADRETFRGPRLA